MLHVFQKKIHPRTVKLCKMPNSRDDSVTDIADALKDTTFSEKKRHQVCRVTGDLHIFCRHLGVSKTRCVYPPKWMVKIRENPIKHGMIWGETPLFLETPIWVNVVGSAFGYPWDIISLLLISMTSCAAYTVYILYIL